MDVSVDQGPDPQPRSGRVVGALVALVAAGILVVAGSGTPEEVTEDPSESLPPPPSGPTTRPGERLGSLVPGLTGTVVVSVTDPGGGLQLLRWSAAEPSPTVTDLPPGTLTSDAWGRYLAVLVDNRYQAGDTLWIGDASYLEPLAFRAESVVWHSAWPGWLAWSSPDDAMVRRGRIRLGGSEVILGEVEPGGSGRPVWWADRRLVLHDQVLARLTVIGERGQVLGQMSDVAWFVNGGPLFAAVATPDRALLVAPDLTVESPAPWSADCTSGEFSPMSQTRIALLCSSGADRVQRLQVWERGESGFALVYEETVEGALPPRWDPSGRVLVVPLVDARRSATDLLFLRFDPTPVGHLETLTGVALSLEVTAVTAP